MHVYAAFFISQLKGLFTDTIKFRENKKKGHKTSFHKEECSFPLTSLGLTGRRAAPPVSSLSKERIFLELVSFCPNTQFHFLNSQCGDLSSLSPSHALPPSARAQILIGKHCLQPCSFARLSLSNLPPWDSV